MDNESHNHLVSVIRRLQLCAAELNRILDAGGNELDSMESNSVDYAIDRIAMVNSSLYVLAVASKPAIGKEPETVQDPIGNKPFIYGETGAGLPNRNAAVEYYCTEASREVDAPLDEMWMTQEDITSAIEYVEFVGKRTHAESQ